MSGINLGISISSANMADIYSLIKDLILSLYWPVFVPVLAISLVGFLAYVIIKVIRKASGHE